jgi:hypothetical protein
VRELIERFFAELDAYLRGGATAGERLDLYLIGRSALIWSHGLALGSGATKDVDVLQIGGELPPLLRNALDSFGKGTEDAKRLGLYLEPVPDALPPVPSGFKKRWRLATGRSCGSGSWKCMTWRRRS